MPELIDIIILALLALPATIVVAIRLAIAHSRRKYEREEAMEERSRDLFKSTEDIHA